MSEERSLEEILETSYQELKVARRRNDPQLVQSIIETISLANMMRVVEKDRASVSNEGAGNGTPFDMCGNGMHD